MKTKFNNLKLRFFGSPLLMLPSKAETVLQILSEKFDGKEMAAIDISSKPDESYEVLDGVAAIEMRGTLVKTGSWANSLSGIASYSATKTKIQQAMSDPTVEQLLLVVDSGGGEAKGVADLADYIRKAKLEKPIHCFVDGCSASAAYWIASPCTSITISQDATVGSIGAVMALKQLTGMAEKEGVKVHLFFAGNAKVDGSPFSEFSEDQKKRLQDRIDSIYSLFVKSVSLDGRLDEQAIRDTEARVYTGQDAVDMGLADSVGTLETLFTSIKGGSMPKEKAEEAKAEVEVSTISQAQLDEAIAQAKAEAIEEGAKLEAGRRTEIDALTILGCEKIAEQAKAENWDVNAFLKAQTLEQQKTVATAKEDAKLNHINELRNEAGEEEAIIPVSTKEPVAKVEVEKLERGATEEEVKAAYEADETIRAEFPNYEDFKALVSFQDYKKEVK